LNVLRVLFGRFLRNDIIKKFAPVQDLEKQVKIISEWSQFFFGDKTNQGHYWVQTEVPDLHKGFYRGLFNEYRYYWLTGPRGFAKTTVAALIYILYRIYYGMDPYIVLIGKIDKSGIADLKNIKREIVLNLKLREVYGNLMPPKTMRLDKGYPWSSHEIKTANGVFLRSIGMGGDIRGSLEAQYRPTLILGQDVQTIKTLREPATLEGHYDYWERDVMNAVDARFGKVRMIGNVLGRGCLLLDIMEDRRWAGMDFAALVNEDGTKAETYDEIMSAKSTWESYFPTKKLRKEYRQLYKQGKEDIFLFERQNIAVDLFENDFSGYKYFHGHVEWKNGQNILITDEFPEPIPVYTYLDVDPAFSKANNSDARALVTKAVGRFPVTDESGNITFFNGTFIVEYYYGHCDPGEIIDMALKFHVKYRYRRVVVEAVGGQLIYDSLMHKAMVKDPEWFKHPFQFTPVTYQPMAKFDRILADIQPRCKAGLFFIQPHMHEIEDELKLFTRNKRGVHILDAIEMGNKYVDICNEELRTYDPDDNVYRMSTYEEDLKKYGYQMLG